MSNSPTKDNYKQIKRNIRQENRPFGNSSTSISRMLTDYNQQEDSNKQQIMLIQSLSEENKMLKDKLKKKDEVLKQMKDFQTDLCKTFEEAQEEMKEKKKEKEFKINEYQILVKELNLKIRDLEEQNTILLREQQLEQIQNQAKLQQKLQNQQDYLEDYCSISQINNVTNNHLNSLNPNGISILEPTALQFNNDKINNSFYNNNTTNNNITQNKYNQECDNTTLTQNHIIQQSQYWESEINKELNCSEISQSLQKIKEHNKFIQCLQKTVENLVPQNFISDNKQQQQEIQKLKKIWKYLKGILQEYAQIKQKSKKNEEIILLLLQYFEIQDIDQIIPNTAALLVNNEVFNRVYESAKIFLNMQDDADCTPHSVELALEKLSQNNNNQKQNDNDDDNNYQNKENYQFQQNVDEDQDEVIIDDNNLQGIEKEAVEIIDLEDFQDYRIKNI